MILLNFMVAAATASFIRPPNIPFDKTGFYPAFVSAQQPIRHSAIKVK
jgi:hypothetical protein